MSVPFMEKVSTFYGKGQHLLWKRSAPFMENVSTFYEKGQHLL
jgi:hypothetical protein